MAEKEKTELSWDKDPEFLYQITKSYMQGYVENRGTLDDQIWYYQLVLDHNAKPVTRGSKTFNVLDIQYVRDEFVKRFFDEKFNGEGAKKNKRSYADEIKEKLEAALKQKALIEETAKKGKRK